MFVCRRPTQNKINKDPAALTFQWTAQPQEIDNGRLNPFFFISASIPHGEKDGRGVCVGARQVLCMVRWAILRLTDNGGEVVAEFGFDECEGYHEEGHSVIVEGSKLKPIYVRGDDECEGCH